MSKHIDDKDKGDNIAKILGDRLDETKQLLITISFNRMLVGTSQNSSLWYKSQIANLSRFKLEVNKKTNEEKKTVLEATKKAAKELKLTKSQTNKIVKEVNDGINDLNKMIISNHVANVANIKAVAETKKSNVVDKLYNTIRDKMLQTQEYGIVTYQNGRNVKWENYMEMKLRTDIQNDIAKNMIVDGAAVGNIFYITSFYGDCAHDHADYQGKIYVDEDWQNIAPKDRIDEIEQYINSNKIMTVQEVMDAPVYLTTRPNCRHYFQYISIDEVLGIKDEKDLNNKRNEYALNANGKYQPEKYEALSNQRYNERQIRRWKGRLQTEEKLLENLPKSASEQEKLLLESKILMSKRKIRVWQETQRDLLKANKGVLERNYDREAYGRIISDFRIKKELNHLNNNSSGGIIGNVNQNVFRQNIDFKKVKFTDLKLQRNILTVEKMSKKFEIDIENIQIQIEDDPYTLEYTMRNGYYGMSDGENIILFPLAFYDEKSLILTLIHEKQHINQRRKGVEFSEADAYDVEDKWLNENEWRFNNESK
ncbi:MAG: hypothetical protein J6R47_03530 [Acholeplasmatales bacterium]|nr:hypothetical protein [Acholeplasmatales bacterium]